MKKLIALILVVVLALSAVACAKIDSDKTPAPATGASGAPASGAAASKAPAPASGAPASTGSASVPSPASAKGVTLKTVTSVTGDVIRYTSQGKGKIAKADPTTLYVGQMVVIEDGNPGSRSDSPLFNLIYDQLISIDYKTGEYVGRVLKDWKFSDDCKSMTFNMNENVTFHDGSKATAEDVIYSLQRLADGKLSTQSDRNVFGNIDFTNSKTTGQFSGQITFKTPSISFIPGLTKAWVLSKKYIESKGEDKAWWDNTMGTGMYKVKSMVQGDRYNLVRNDSYWGKEKGAFEKVVIRYYAEASTMYIDLESGVLDIIVNPLSTDAKRVVDGIIGNAICDIYSSLQTFSVVFNEEKNPVLADANVRKAIYLAIDPAVVTKMAYDFLGAPANSTFAEGVKDAYFKDHKTDVEAAKKALADAGYKPGQLKLVFGTNTQNVNMSMAEALQAQIEEIGIKIEIRAVDPNAHVTNFRNTGTDIYDMSLTRMDFGTLDPSSFLGSVSKACGSMSFTAITDPYVDELSLKARAAVTAKEKTDALTKLQEYIFDKYWMVPIVKAKTAIIYKDYIQGIQVIQPRSPDLTAVKLVG